MGALAPRTFVGAALGAHLVRVDVLDRQGHVKGTTARLVVGSEARTNHASNNTESEACAVTSVGSGRRAGDAAWLLLGAIALVSKLRVTARRVAPGAIRKSSGE